MGEEGESELHPGVEKEIDEVGQANLLQFSVLLLFQIGEAGKPGEEGCQLQERRDGELTT